MSAKITCPECGQTGQVEKVSTIYLTGIGLRKRDLEGEDLLDGFASPDEIAALSHRMAPPASPKQVLTRPIHPDQAVIAFSAVVPIFVYGIYTNQAVMLLPVLLLLAGFYAAYFWQRRKLILRYQRDQAARKADGERVKRALEHWMKLYYCLGEDGVFEPGASTLTPLDNLPDLLNRDP